MSLWTPDGEHHVPPTPPTRPAPEPAAQRPPDRGPDPDDAEGFHPDDAEGFYYDDTDEVAIEDLPGFDELTPEQQAEARAMAAELTAARRRLAEAPAATVVANHAMGIYELAAIHLTSEPPSPDEARVAIDALAGLVQACGDRLGENGPVLRQALQQLQVAYVQITES